MQVVKSFQFLERLYTNNNKEWFDKNRSEYQIAKAEFELFIQNAIEIISRIDSRVEDLEAKKAIFRIFRDVRFSKNKIPYKTNFGAAIASGGRKSPFAGYYIHISPNNESFIAGGLYHPEPKILSAIRQEIDYNGDDFLNKINDTSFKSFYGGLWDQDRLKLAPKGYAKDHPNIEILKNKSFLVSHQITDNEVLSGDIMNVIMKGAQLLKPFNDFLNVVIEEDIN